MAVLSGISLLNTAIADDIVVSVDLGLVVSGDQVAVVADVLPTDAVLVADVLVLPADVVVDVLPADVVVDAAPVDVVVVDVLPPDAIVVDVDPVSGLVLAVVSDPITGDVVPVVVDAVPADLAGVVVDAAPVDVIVVDVLPPDAIVVDVDPVSGLVLAVVSAPITGDVVPVVVDLGLAPDPSALPADQINLDGSSRLSDRPLAK